MLVQLQQQFVWEKTQLYIIPEAQVIHLNGTPAHVAELLSVPETIFLFLRLQQQLITDVGKMIAEILLVKV